MLLRRVEHGDSDLILTFLGRDRGVLSAFARGARRSKRRFAGCLSWFAISDVELRRRRGSELYSLTSANLVRDNTPLAIDPATLAHASYATELCRELLAAEQPEPAVFELLTGFYATLREHGASRRALRCFELMLLRELGIAPTFARCARCGTDDEADLARGAVLDPQGAGVACATCAATIRGTGVRPLGDEARRELLAASRVPSLEAAATLESDADTSDQVEASRAMTAIISRHLSKPLRSLEFIAKMSRPAGTA